VPDSLPQPDSLIVVQDTLNFGGFLHLVLDYTNLSPEEILPRVVADGQWLAAADREPWTKHWYDGEAVPELDLSAMPTVAGERMVLSFRVYRSDPFKILWQDYASSVLVVRGQTDGVDQTATIRQPRSLAWTPWRLILAAFILLVLAVLLYGWWRRRQRPAALSHWQPRDPAWLALSLGLKKLIGDNILARGHSREFLDRLASLTREYVAGRYRIAAREMTGEEIINACQRLGHDLNHPRGFAGLIKWADRKSVV